MALIRKIAKEKKGGARWRSPAHLNHVRSHACVTCDASAPIEAAHVRIGSDAGMGRKPSDYYAVPLCKSCHGLQHQMGERSFWGDVQIDPREVMAELIATSPKRREIEAHRNG